MAEQMIIMTRTFELLAWLLPKSQAFPRIYRFTLTQRIMHVALDFQEQLIMAQTQRGRERLMALRHCDARLRQLKLYLRMIHQWQWLSDGQYHHVSNLTAEIGRMLGGWIKQS